MASSSRDNPEFRLEADLVACARSMLPEFFAARGMSCRITSELTVGAAIADIVVAADAAPFEGTYPLLSARQAVLLAALRNAGPTRVDILERRCGLPHRALRGPELRRFEERGLVAWLPGGRLRVGPGWGFDVQLIAIEAKLLRWRAALKQAARYTSYADVAYVLLPADALDDSRCLDECRIQGIGVLVVTEGTIEEKIAPLKHHSHGWHRDYALSRVLANGTP